MQDSGNGSDRKLQLKVELKNTYDVLNKNKEPLKKYKLLNELASLYLNQDDINEYPKVIAIYQYLHKLIKKYTEIVNQEINAEVIDRIIAIAEARFVEKVTKKHVSEEHAMKNLNTVRKHRVDLGKHRKEVVATLKSIEDFGIKKGQVALDEKGLEERAKKVEEIYGDINKFFIGERGLIKQLLSECIEELGGIPLITKAYGTRQCEYAIFGMGSMSLRTMTPWSDIEFGVLIEEELTMDDQKRVKDFFRNVFVLLNMKVINFGESVLHYQGVKELNDFSTTTKDNWFGDELPPKGFCFDAMLPDGCKTPLGRKGYDGYENYELIRTPKELLEFQQDSKWQIKDMPLVQALWHTVLIAGSIELLKRYQKSLNKEVIKEHSFRILREDARKFDPFEQIQNEQGEGKILKVKKEIYRFPDRVVVALGDCLDGEGDSSWAVIRNSKLEDTLKKSLQLALSIATELRLRAYANNNGRNEDVSVLAKYESQLKELSNEGLKEEVFYLKDIRLLYKYYQIVTDFSLRINTITDRESLLTTNKILVSEPQKTLINGLIYNRFLKYYDAIREFESLEQNNISANALAKLYYITGRYNEALKYYQKNLDEIRNKGNYVEISRLLSNLGLTLRQLGRFQEAFERFQESLEIRRERYQGSHVDIAESLNDVGNAFVSLGRYEEALQSFKESLEMRLRLYVGENVDIADLLNLEISDKLDIESHTDIAESFNDTGSALECLGKYDDALAYYRKGLEVRSRVYRGDHVDIARSLSNVGNIFGLMGENKEALQYFQESMKMVQRIYQDDHVDIAESKNEIGDVYMRLGEYDKAMQCFQESLDMLYRLYGNANHPSIAKTLNYMGNTLEHLSRYDEALTKKQASLNMRHAIYGDKHVSIAISMGSVGNTLERLGRYDEALQQRQKSLEMLREIYIGNHTDIAESLNSYGTSLERLGRYTEALEKFQESLLMIRGIYKGNHAYVATLLNNVGTILELLGKHDEALQYCQDGLKMRHAVHNANHPDIAASLYNIGNILGSLGRHKEALQYKQESLEMRRVIYHGNHASIAISLNSIGSTLKNLRMYEEAMQNHLEGLSMMQNIYGDDHADIATVLNNISNTLRHQGEFREAYDYAIKAKNMYSKFLPEDHPHVKEANGNLNRATIGLANNEILAGNLAKGLEYYRTISSTVESSTLAIFILISCSQLWQKNELELTISSYEVLNVKLMPTNRVVKHNLACIYHIKALMEKEDNHENKYTEYLSKARTTFEAAISINIENNQQASICVEYAQFLLKYHDSSNNVEYDKIKRMLENAINLDDESVLGYDQPEKGIVCRVLQELLDEQDEISIKPKFLAYYLMVRLYLTHGNLEGASEILEAFKIQCGSFELNEAEQEIEVEQYLYICCKDELESALAKKQPKKNANNISGTVEVMSSLPVSMSPNGINGSTINLTNANNNPQQASTPSNSHLGCFRSFDIFRCFSRSVEVADNFISTTSQTSISENATPSRLSCFQWDCNLLRCFSNKINVVNEMSAVAK